MERRSFVQRPTLKGLEQERGATDSVHEVNDASNRRTGTWERRSFFHFLCFFYFLCVSVVGNSVKLWVCLRLAHHLVTVYIYFILLFVTYLMFWVIKYGDKQSIFAKL